jgi:hypothetical protein
MTAGLYMCETGRGHKSFAAIQDLICLPPARPRKRTLPDNEPPPAKCIEFFQNLRVACSVGSDFRRPEIAARGGKLEEWTGVAVPEAAVDKYDGTLTGKDEVWAAGKLCDVEPITKAATMEGTPDKHFRFGVPAFDAAHVETPLLECQYVHRVPAVAASRSAPPHVLCFNLYLGTDPCADDACDG